MRSLFLEIFILALAVIVGAKDVLVRMEAGDAHKVAVYYPGEKIPSHPVFHKREKENFVVLLNHNEVKTELVNYGSSFIYRSDDLVTRFQVDFSSSKNKTLPYTIAFHNLHANDRGGNKPIELQHGTSGYIWIDGGKSVTHYTAANHKFILRDTSKKPIVTVALFAPKAEL